VYWLPGNGEPFLGLVEKLTGSPLRADAWVDVLQVPLDKMVGAGVALGGCHSAALPLPCTAASTGLAEWLGAAPLPRSLSLAQLQARGWLSGWGLLLALLVLPPPLAAGATSPNTPTPTRSWRRNALSTKPLWLWGPPSSQARSQTWCVAAWVVGQQGCSVRLCGATLLPHLEAWSALLACSRPTYTAPHHLHVAAAAPRPCHNTPCPTLPQGMRVRLVHGDELISDSADAGGLAGACQKFKEWVGATYFQQQQQ